MERPGGPRTARLSGAFAGLPAVTPTQVMLVWLLRSPTMLRILGTLSIEHVRENLGALDLELTDEEFAALS